MRFYFKSDEPEAPTLCSIALSSPIYDELSQLDGALWMFFTQFRSWAGHVFEYYNYKQNPWTESLHSIVRMTHLLAKLTESGGTCDWEKYRNAKELVVVANAGQYKPHLPSRDSTGEITAYGAVFSISRSMRYEIGQLNEFLTKNPLPFRVIKTVELINEVYRTREAYELIAPDGAVSPSTCTNFWALDNALQTWYSENNERWSEALRPSAQKLSKIFSVKVAENQGREECECCGRVKPNKPITLNFDQFELPLINEWHRCCAFLIENSWLLKIPLGPQSPQHVYVTRRDVGVFVSLEKSRMGDVAEKWPPPDGRRKKADVWRYDKLREHLAMAFDLPEPGFPVCGRAFLRQVDTILMQRGEPAINRSGPIGPAPSQTIRNLRSSNAKVTPKTPKNGQTPDDSDDD